MPDARPTTLDVSSSFEGPSKKLETHVDRDSYGSSPFQKPIWRNTTIIRDNVVDTIRALKAKPGKNIITDGSSQLVHTLLSHDLVDELHLLLYPLTVGKGKRLFPEGQHARFTMKEATPYPTGVVGVHYVRERS